MFLCKHYFSDAALTRFCSQQMFVWVVLFPVLLFTLPAMQAKKKFCSICQKNATVIVVRHHIFQSILFCSVFVYVPNRFWELEQAFSYCFKLKKQHHYSDIQYTQSWHAKPNWANSIIIDEHPVLLSLTLCMVCNYVGIVSGSSKPTLMLYTIVPFNLNVKIKSQPELDPIVTFLHTQ